MKRLEAVLHPDEPEAMVESEFAKHPSLVKGYIGTRVLGEESESKLRYLVDPRVVEGTRWITGANQPGRHVFDLVAGRDFTADGTIEAAEIVSVERLAHRANSLAPSGAKWRAISRRRSSW